MSKEHCTHTKHTHTHAQRGLLYFSSRILFRRFSSVTSLPILMGVICCLTHPLLYKDGFRLPVAVRTSRSVNRARTQQQYYIIYILRFSLFLARIPFLSHAVLTLFFASCATDLRQYSAGVLCRV